MIFTKHSGHMNFFILFSRLTVMPYLYSFFFLNDPAPTKISPLPLHAPLPIYTPNTPEVNFRLGSITKQFTSMLIMQQVARGTIKRDGHLSDYPPYYRHDTGSKVTISQLLSHTSGIPESSDDPKSRLFAELSRSDYTVDDFVKKFCSGDLQFEPGTKYRYDNTGYFLLGAILEHEIGKT